MCVYCFILEIKRFFIDKVIKTNKNWYRLIKCMDVRILFIQKSRYKIVRSVEQVKNES